MERNKQGQKTGETIGSRALADWIARLTASKQCRHPQKMVVSLAPDCRDIQVCHLPGFNLGDDLLIGFDELNTRWARDLFWNQIAIDRNQLEVILTSVPPNDIYRLPQISIVVKTSREYMNVLATQKRCDIRHVHYHDDRIVAVEANPLCSINVLPAAGHVFNHKMRSSST